MSTPINTSALQTGLTVVQSYVSSVEQSAQTAQSEIRMNVLKKEQSQAEFMIQKLIVDTARSADPKSMNATFEFLA